MSEFPFRSYQEVTDTSISLSGKFGSNDASWYGEPSINLAMDIISPNLLLQADVSHATGYVYLQKSLTGTSWWTIDGSLVFDASLITTSYYKEYTSLIPTTKIRALMPTDTSDAVSGHIDTITLRNPLGAFGDRKINLY